MRRYLRWIRLHQSLLVSRYIAASVPQWKLHRSHIANSRDLDKQVRELAFEYAPFAAEEAWADEVAQSEPAPPTAEEPTAQVGTDPTIAHAGMTEIDAEAEPMANGQSHVDVPTVPEVSNIDAGAANAAAGNNWDASASVDQGADSWVEVSRDPAETETGIAATPAAMAGTQSWADEVPTEMPAATAPAAEPKANGGDGFHEVHHGRGGRGRNGSQGEHRGGHRGRGGFRGDRGGEGGHRGRGGFRGDRGGGEGGYRGRGRGGFRGNRGRGEGPPAQ